MPKRTPIPVRQLDLDLAKRLRDAGKDLVEENSEATSTWMSRMRDKAKEFSLSRGFVTSDHLRSFADHNGFHPHHPNAWGAVFRGKGWVQLGFIQSRYVTNHARVIRKWKWVGGEGV